MKRTLVIALALAAISSQAQLVITGPATITQDFDSLASSGTGIGFTNNLPTALMPGWYSNQQSYDADNGSLANSGQYSYGSTPSPERALGSVALPGALIVYGIRIQNGTSSTINSLYLDYTGEQWRSGSTLTDVLSFSYSTNATSLFTGTYTNLTALDFNSPNNSGAGAINGNLAANQSFQSATLTGLGLAPGAEMWVKWTHVGNASRHGLALDDMHLQANPVPEPISLTGVAIAAVGLISRRRRKA